MPNEPIWATRMAWIKIEVCTLEKIEVARIATALALDRYSVLGRLIHLWSYFDTHSLDGYLDGIDALFVDKLVGHCGFADAVAKVGWLEFRADGIALPNYGRHNGATAKARSQAARRQEKSRARDYGHGASVTNVTLNRDGGRDQRRLDEIRSEMPQAQMEVTATELAQEFAFRGGEGTSMAAINRARAVMVDLLMGGITVEAIRGDLNRPERAKSEHPGDLRRRLLPKKTEKNPRKSRTEHGDLDPSKTYPSAKQGA